MPEGLSVAPSAQPKIDATPQQGPRPNSGYVIPNEVYAYFDIENEQEMANAETKRKLNNILAFVSEKSGQTNLGDLLLAIRQIEDEVGKTNIVNRHDRVYQYITIQRQINDLEKQKKAFFNGTNRQS